MPWNLEEAIDYYKKKGAPSDQNALIGLLREIQQENGGRIPRAAILPVADGCRVKESLLLALIRRIPSLRLADTHCLEICGGPNCSKRADLMTFVEKNCPPGVEVKEVPCMRLCGKGPNVRWDGQLYHQADPELLRRLLEKGRNP
jgi:NADH:ubiquinone oxidoreductase subunit E